MSVAFAALGLLLMLGWCAGSRQIGLEARGKPCDCRRCWYVNEPPEGTPMCRVTKIIAIVGVAGLAFMLLRSLAGKKKSEAVTE